ncbi:2OG-Fe(II) oxygenase [Marinobacter sp.]|uniref:2OG-Fe(II) oxygenase n=1 Tax=Marinobacter sp. TaxID=50741 RepID=UPI0019DDFC25|nr:2OG-Fe(II) oxygenase [Marinobacter sp.]MBE0485034.1 2OG-Fe(II) oxygenase [Marinobacter sp.]
MNLRAGMPFPDFVLPAVNGVNALFYEQYCGKPALLVFSSSPGSFGDLEKVNSAHLNVIVFGKSCADPNGRVIIHAPERLSDRLRSNDPLSTTAVLLDSSLRVEQIINRPSPEYLADLATEVLPTNNVGRTVTSTAPVLIEDSIIEPGMARELISVHQSENFQSGMDRGLGGEQQLKVDARLKSRWDHPLTDQTLVRELNNELTERLIPIITRTFHFRPSQFEGYKIVAYRSSDNGRFELHRDNVAKAVRHRRLALSVNLNAEFEGGELIFPEYSTDRYRPGTGSAIVFSGSLLHGVNPVTAGVRYALITFLW